MFDYLAWRGDLDFNASPFNPVDSVILSQLSYLTLDGIVPGPDDNDAVSIALAVRVYNEKINSPEGLKLTSTFKEDPDLIRALGSSKRFGDCQLFGYVNKFDTERELQFSALCVYKNDYSCFVAYRGTDTSIIGWKEDINMCFKDVIPSQSEAADYLDKMAAVIAGSIRVGGHSKGGNLAIYAASKCGKKVQQRITDVYSNDSPGFKNNFLKSAGFLAVKDRIHSYIPQASVVGMFLERGNECTVIKSNEKGLMQHSLYSWEVTRNDLVRAEKSTAGSRFINNTLREWIESFSVEYREQFIEALYHIFSVADVNSITELEKSWFTVAGKVFKSLNNVEEPKRKLIRNVMKGLFDSARRNLETLFEAK